MEVIIRNDDITTIEAGLIALPVAGDEPSESLLQGAKASGLDIWGLAKSEQFKGEPGQSFMLRGVQGMGTSRVLLVGIGSDDSREFDSVRAAGTSVARQAKTAFVGTFAIVAPAGKKETLQFAEGAILGTYRFDRHVSRKDDDFEGFETLIIASTEDIADQVAEARVVAAGVNLARDLVNETPNHLTPEAMAAKARQIGSEYHLDTNVFDESHLEREGFNLIMAVGKGSVHPPRLIHMIYRPAGEVKCKIAFVGKGITFDTGGYNLKPGASMLAMHSDMAGAAAVLGAARAIGELKPQGVEVHFVVPTAENSVSGNAMRPQDIIRGYGNKTVEIQNTDAEGRLVLADALAYIQEHKVDTIIDLATLTGACVVALGDGTAGLFSNDETLIAGIQKAADTTGEDFWRLPLNAKMDSLLDTPMADMRNIGPRWGGAITAALFLKRFVDLKAWAHMDIAGPAYAEKDSPIAPTGGTGFGVATLVQYTIDASK